VTKADKLGENVLQLLLAFPHPSGDHAQMKTNISPSRKSAVIGHMVCVSAYILKKYSQ
jgi:hypothetical protein